MLKYLIGTVLITLVLLWSSYEYPNNTSISDDNGKPTSDSTYYFPIEYFIDSIKWTNTTEIKPDTSSVKWFSQDLWLSKEPILYNFYLDRSIYRLTWLRSFHPAIIIRLENKNGEINILEKKMTLVNPWKPVIKDTLEELDNEADGSVMKYSPDSAVIEFNSKRVSEKKWLQFEQLLDVHNFNSMPTSRAWEFGTDGSEWILEEHKENSYHVVNRWSPSEQRYSSFRRIGDFLIDLSSYKKEERY